MLLTTTVAVSKSTKEQCKLVETLLDGTRIGDEAPHLEEWIARGS